MERPLLLAALVMALATPASAAIYKWTDDKGQVHYSDKPREGAEPIEVDTSKATTIELVSPRPITNTPPPEVLEAPSYRIKLIEPDSEATVRDNNGQLNLSISLEPELLPDHRIELLLDGEVVRTVGGAGSFALDNLDRGEHSLQARVIDENGKVLASSGKRTVFLHRHSRLIPPLRPQPRSDGGS
ncbi:DUF4124 domain-containing protein [Ferrimonas balearica]|uniref:DUF4124 domain-containing protein n=1 Tax=Ferrimonas balearica TaxID=44012 RepID=UPI001C98E5A9|nr:DUF4124 domain-containing protein [Ferrimonas balearica]MBY5994119.1 DUF4124 domain-containing protein [Ferrimonas balearica]